MRSRATMWMACGALGLTMVAAWPDGSTDRGARAAQAAVRLLGGDGKTSAVVTRDAQLALLRVDGRWSVHVDLSGGEVIGLRDTEFLSSAHGTHALLGAPSSEEIERAGRELIARVFPGFDMTEFVLESAKPLREQARVEAVWRHRIPESGFPASGRCSVDFCWPDRAICTIRARDWPIRDAWRKPATVTAEQAEAVARKALGDLRGGWLQTTKGLCVLDARDASRSRPAWNVLLLYGPRDKPGQCESSRSVFVDPWTGEIIHTTTWKSAGAGPAEPQAKPSNPATLPAAQPPADAEAERSGHGRWLLAAGAGLLVLALGAAMVCVRRRRA